MSRHQKTGEAMSRHHEIAPLPENMVWGYLDAAVSPVLKIASGDTVRLSSWAAADEEDLPPDRSLVDPGHLRAMRELVRGPASHMLTGPVHVEGAEPGDVLQIEILEITLADGWGFVGMLPLRGTLPEDFDTAPLVIHATIDRECRTCRLPWGLELALDPFFGILAVAPPAHWVTEYYPVTDARPGPRGSLDVDLEVASEAWLRQLLFRVAPHASVVAPQEFADSFTADAQAAVRLYTDPGVR